MTTMQRSARRIHMGNEMRIVALKPGEVPEEIYWEPSCGEDCKMCSGEACMLCGAGLWRNPSIDGPPCEHGVLDRHREDLTP